MPTYAKYVKMSMPGGGIEEEGTYCVEERIESSKKIMGECKEAINSHDPDAAEYAWRLSHKLLYSAYLGALGEDQKLVDLILEQEKELKALVPYIIQLSKI